MKSPACVLLIVFMLLVAGITYSTAQTIRRSGADLQIYDGGTWRSMNNATLGACTAGEAGTMRYNAGAARIEFCSGTNWMSMDSGTNAGSCSGTPAGTMRYNGGYSQFCNGTNWRNGYTLAVAGVCGSAESGASTSAPSSNLCNPGTASGVTTNATTFTWTCAGSGGGATDSCSKPRQVNGSCAAAHYNCSAGTSNSSVVADTTTYWNWRCDGINGGSNSSTCTQQRPGLCGSAESGASTTAPSGGTLCTTGSASGVTTNATTFTWSCTGSSTDSCSKPRQVNGSCGSAASGAAVASQPTSNQCSSGTYADTGDTASYWQWYCNGTNGGSSPLCQRARSSGGASCSAQTRGSNGCHLPFTLHGATGEGTCTGTGSCSAICNNGSWTSFEDDCGCQFC